VAFKIYYIMAWRAGKTHLLQSALTRAVIFSAMTTATAFGSLWASPSPGLSSMGKLMALALICTMTAAVLFQAVLTGPPRKSSKLERDATLFALQGDPDHRADAAPAKSLAEFGQVPSASITPSETSELETTE